MYQEIQGHNITPTTGQAKKKHSNADKINASHWGQASASANCRSKCDKYMSMTP